MASSSQELRVELAELFGVVHGECEKVRASELMRQQAEAVAAGTPYSPPDRTQERYPGAIDLANNVRFQDDYPEGVDLVLVRARIRDELKKYRSTLSTRFSTVEAFEILFPITIHCDELFRTAAGRSAHRWEPLQSELFDIEDGGEQFFARLRGLLEADDVHPFVYEVYYFCLSDNFQGRWRGHDARLGEFRRLLKERIGPRRPPPTVKREMKQLPVQAVRFPWEYYVLAAATIVGVYVVLFFVGQAGW